jgi:hypothetical protein
MEQSSDTIIDLKGNALPGVAIRVFADDGSLAQLFSDNGLTPVSNPTYTDQNGRYVFYAANGRYTTRIEPPDGTEYEGREMVLFDPQDNGAEMLAFIQAGGGAVPRSLESKSREVLSVLDFMTEEQRLDVLNGVGALDVQYAVQAAVSAAQNRPNGAAVFAPGGRYRLSAPVLLNLAKSLVFFGDGKATQFFGATAFGYIFEITTSSNNAYGSVFRDFMVSPALTGRTSGIKATNANAFVFRDVTLQGQDNPMSFASSYAVRISCTFDVAASEAIKFTTSAHHANLEGSKFYSCGIINSKPAVSFEVASNNLILDNTDFEVNYQAFSLNNCTSVSIKNCYIEYNKVNDIAFVGTCVGVSMTDGWIYAGDTPFTIGNVDGMEFKRQTVGKVVNVGSGVANLDCGGNALVPGGAVNVNYVVKQASASGANPVTLPEGPDPDIQFRMSSKGAADIVGYTGSQGVLAFVAIHVPGAVNYVRFEPATTGVPASVRGFGEANAGLRLIARGTGIINAASAFRFDGNVGFYGTAPVAKPAITGSAGGNAAVASIAAALAALGLVTNNTTA